MLYEIARHEPVATIAWDETRIREVIQAIASDTEAHFDPQTFWSIHPLDLDFPTSLTSFKSLYGGAAGVIWALHYLSQMGAVSLKRDYAHFSAKAYEAYLLAPDTEEVVPSYYLGEVGILLVAWRLSASQEVGDRLFTQIQNNITNPTNEALWAAPGTMIGALFMYQWTGEKRWEALFLENVEYIWSEWKYEPDWDCYLWTQDLYGSIVKLLGAAHGWAGNVYPLLRGASLLTPKRREELYQRCGDTLQKLARVEGNEANWFPSVNSESQKLLVQWCHGSPGMVTALGDFPKDYAPEIEELCLKAGELTWKAGLLTKGAGICHGTAGNGYAFLKLYQRTRSVQWLERARAFAMSATIQYEQSLQQYNRGRYSLWTGDLGLAVYLWHCISGEANLPSLDIL